MNLSKMLKMSRRSLSKKSPEIAIGVGIFGFVLTAISAVRATPKCMKLLEEKKKEKEEAGEEPELTVVETVKIAAPVYVPSIVTGVFSAGCILFAQRKYSKKIAGLTSALTITTDSFNRYKEKTKEIIGEQKEGRIRDEIALDQQKNNPIPNDVNRITGNGRYLCYETFGGHYFRADKNVMDRIENDIRRKFSGTVLDDGSLCDIEDWVPYSYVYELLHDYVHADLEPTDSSELLGWNRTDGDPKFIYTWGGDSSYEPMLIISCDTSTENYTGLKKRYPVNH